MLSSSSFFIIIVVVVAALVARSSSISSSSIRGAVSIMPEKSRSPKLLPASAGVLFDVSS
jgi:hypothetical protein